MNVTIDTHKGDTSVDIASLTVAQMKAYAATNNIKLDGLTLKKDIQERIETVVKEREDAPPATGSTDDTQPPEGTPPEASDIGAGQPPAADMEGTPPATGSTDGTQPPEGTPPEAGDTGAGQPPFVIDRVLKVTKPLLKGDDVKAVQGALIANGFHCGIEGASGTYEKYTAYAVRCFQAAHGLIVDGKAGRYTVTALGGEWQEPPSETI